MPSSWKNRQVRISPERHKTHRDIYPLPVNTNKRLKIAILVRRFITTGGMERYCVEVTRRLARNHDVHVFAQEYIWEGPERITFHRIPKFFTKPSFLNLLVFSFFTRRSLDESFDIVHSHERVTHFDTLTVHCPCFRTHIAKEKRWWKKVLIWSSVLFSPRKMAYLWLEKRQFAYHDRRLLIAVSKKIKENVRETYHLPDGYFSLAYPGVDSEPLKRAHNSENRERMRAGLGIGEEDLIVLFVGTEFRRKGLDTLLEGFAVIHGNNMKLLVAGGGDPRGYQRLAGRLGIGDRIIFLGLVDDIENVYAMSDIYILPTLSEPAGMSPIEAMAAGLPTVLSSAKYAGSAELITNNEAIILENPEQPQEIARSLTRLMDGKTRSDLGKRGRQLAEQLTWERTTEETLKVYERIVNH